MGCNSRAVGSVDRWLDPGCGGRAVWSEAQFLFDGRNPLLQFLNSLIIHMKSIDPEIGLLHRGKPLFRS